MQTSEGDIENAANGQNDNSVRARWYGDVRLRVGWMDGGETATGDRGLEGRNEGGEMPRGNDEQKLESCGGMRAGRAKYREGE